MSGIVIRMKFLGALEKIFQAREREMSFSGDSVTLQEVLLELLRESSNDPTFKDLFDSEGKPKRSLIVLVNGAMHDAVGGVSVSLKDGDEVVLLPTIHGGAV